jgi:hypothetical protein
MTMYNAPVRKMACWVSRKLGFLVFHKMQCNHIAISSACIGQSSYIYCMASGKILLKLQLSCSFQGQRDRYFFKYINFPLTVSFHQHSTFIHSSPMLYNLSNQQHHWIKCFRKSQMWTNTKFAQ